MSDTELLETIVSLLSVIAVTQCMHFGAVLVRILIVFKNQSKIWALLIAIGYTGTADAAIEVVATNSGSGMRSTAGQAGDCVVVITQDLYYSGDTPSPAGTAVHNSGQVAVRIYPNVPASYDVDVGMLNAVTLRLRGTNETVNVLDFATGGMYASSSQVYAGTNELLLGVGYSDDETDPGYLCCFPSSFGTVGPLDVQGGMGSGTGFSADVMSGMSNLGLIMLSIGEGTTGGNGGNGGAGNAPELGPVGDGTCIVWVGRWEKDGTEYELMEHVYGPPPSPWVAHPIGTRGACVHHDPPGCSAADGTEYFEVLLIDECHTACNFGPAGDMDDDGIPDAQDATPRGSCSGDPGGCGDGGDADGDGIRNDAEADADGDGIGNAEDSTPYGAGCGVPDACSDAGDADGDGIRNDADPDGDQDGDGIADAIDATPRGCGYGECGDGGDADGDGIRNDSDPDLDIDGDGTPDDQDPTPYGENCDASSPCTDLGDADGDGIQNRNDPDGDQDGDGIPDDLDFYPRGDDCPKQDLCITQPLPLPEIDEKKKCVQEVLDSQGNSLSPPEYEPYELPEIYEQCDFDGDGCVNIDDPRPCDPEIKCNDCGFDLDEFLERLEERIGEEIDVDVEFLKQGFTPGNHREVYPVTIQLPIIGPMDMQLLPSPGTIWDTIFSSILYFCRYWLITITALRLFHAVMLDLAGW